MTTSYQREICIDKGNVTVQYDVPLNVVRAFLNTSIRDAANLANGAWSYTVSDFTYWEKVAGNWVSRGTYGTGSGGSGTPAAGPAGRGVVSITATGNVATVTFTDATTATFNLPVPSNGVAGRSVTSITAAGTVATVNYSDGTTSTFNLPSSGGTTQAGPSRNVALTGDLRAVTSPVVGEIVTVRGANAEADTGAGYWTWFSGTAPSDDGIVYIQHSTISSGYFKRMGFDGVTVDLAWAGKTASVGSAWLQTAINTFPGLNVLVDKLYTGLSTALQLPANTNFVLRGKSRDTVGFVSNGTLTTVLKVGIGNIVENLTVDGNYATRAQATGYSTESLIQFPYNASTKNTTKVARVTLRNAAQHAIYGNTANYTTVEDVLMENINAEALWFQVSDHLFINKIRGRNNQKDGIKIHSKDGVATTAQLYDVTIKDVNLDYSTVTGTGNMLAVELWGGQVGWINNPNLEGIKVIGPAGMSSGVFWGISGDTVKGGQVNNFVVDGGTPGYVGIAIEAAGCIDFTYRSGTVRKYRFTGASLSQPATRNNKIDNVTFREAVTTGGTYAVQWYNNITGGSIINSTFKDAGDRYLFFNSAGSGVLLQGNKFYLGTQPQGTGSTQYPVAIYVSGGAGVVNGVKVISNEFGSVLWGDDVAVNSHMEPGQIGAATGWLFAFNTLNALNPVGAVYNGQLSTFSGGGGHIFTNNIGLNYTAAFLGQYDSGPASTFIYNVISGSAVVAQSSRTGTDTVANNTGGGTTGLDAEGVQDMFVNFFVPGTNLVGTYNDTANTYTLNAVVPQVTFPATGGVLPRLSGGTPGNFVVRLGAGYADAHPSNLQQLKNGQIYLLGTDNVVRAAGSAGGYEGLRLGELVWLKSKASKYDRNWFTSDIFTSYTPGSNVVATAMLAQVVARDSIAISNPKVTLPSGAAMNFYNDNFTASVGSNYTQPLYSGGYGVGNDAGFTSGKAGTLFANASGITVYSRNQAVPNGSLKGEIKHGGANTADFIFIGLAGAVGSESAYALRIDSSSKFATLGTWLGSRPAGQKFNALSTSVYLPWLTSNGYAGFQIAWQDTRIVAQVFPIGTTPSTTYQLEAYATAPIAGLTAIGTDAGAISIGLYNISAGQLDLDPFFAPTDGVLNNFNDGAPWTFVAGPGDSLSDNTDYLAMVNGIYNTDVMPFGIGGQDTYQISARAGALNPTFTVTGGIIPRSGPVAVTPVGINPLATQNYDRFVMGTLGGVYGKLVIIGNPGYTVIGGTAGSMTFTRSGVGPLVPATSAQVWQSDVSIYKDRMVLIWQGRNNTSSPTMAADVTANAQLINDIVVKQGGIPFHISILFADQAGERTTDGDQTARNRIIATNAALAAAFPGHFIDITTPISTATGGVTPASYRNDVLHLNAAGYAFIKPYIKAVTDAHTQVYT